MTLDQKIVVVALAILIAVGVTVLIKWLIVKMTAGATFAEAVRQAGTAVCNDGWISGAEKCQGQCSWHGGVERRLTPCGCPA